MDQCVYLRGPDGPNATADGKLIHLCDKHGKCTVEDSGESTPMSCTRCPQKLTLASPSFAADFEDPLVVLDRRREQTTALRGMLAGLPTFLVCGGPSAKQCDLGLLTGRGMWSLAVNNMAGTYRPNAFICADPPAKFHEGIWRDPGVMKFVPIPKMSGSRGNLRRKVGDTFEPLQVAGRQMLVADCPNVWAFSRRAWLQTDHTFFTDPEAAWGNHQAGVTKTGLKKTVMTMLLGMRILYHLGSREIYLVGVDFNMDPARGEIGNYAFDEVRKPDAVGSNNSQFTVVNEWLMEMAGNGTFSRFGLKVYNCNRFSGLRAFPYVPFETAVATVLKDFPKEPFDLTGWYEKR